MLIFDSFPDEDMAEDFASHVMESFGLDAIVCYSVEEANEHDIFPFNLYPPIVMVERPGFAEVALEDEIKEHVLDFDGQFAGT